MAKEIKRCKSEAASTVRGKRRPYCLKNKRVIDRAYCRYICKERE